MITFEPGRLTKSSLSIATTSCTVPSAGETIADSSGGMCRVGLRKKYAKYTASTVGKIAAYGLIATPNSSANPNATAMNE